MSEFVRDNPAAGPEEPDAYGIDLVDGDGDEPSVRLLVRGELPESVEHDGRTWVATDETHDPGDDGPPIAVFRPQD